MLDDRQREGLRALGVAVEFDALLAEWTWLRIGGPADALVTEPADEEGRRLLRRWCRRERLKATPAPLAPGVLVREGGLAGVVVVGPTPAPPSIPGLVPGSDRLFADPGLGLSAARLLADAGAAGIRLRGVRIDPDRPDRVVNEGGAVAADVLALADWLAREVRARSGVELKLALDVIGRRPPAA